MDAPATMATTPYEAHLALLTDLLSPISISGELLPAVLRSLQHHLAFLDEPALFHLVQTCLTSSSLWSTPGSGSPDLDRCRDIYNAAHRGVLQRFLRITEEHGTGWRARRRAGKAAQGMLSHCQTGQDRSPLPGLTLATATLRALQDTSESESELFSKGDSWRTSIERDLVHLWRDAASSLPINAQIDADKDTALPFAWLAVQVLPDIASDHLKPLATDDMLSFLFGFIRGCFFDDQLFRGLSADLEDTPEGVRWREDSSSYARLTSLKGSTAHNLLGRIARVAGKIIEATDGGHAELLVVLQYLSTLETLCARVHEDWGSSKWSDCNGPEELHPLTRENDTPWTLLKTLLFSTTMLYSSLISLLNSMPLHATPGGLVLDLASCALRTFSHLYFVTSTFGSDGFGAYRSVWYGSLDLASRAGPARVQQIAENLQPAYASEVERSQSQERTVARSRITYFLNAVEQLVAVLPDEYLASQVLPIAKPYFTDKRFLDTFEAAHSVLLAIFARRKSLSIELAPWYAEFLLESYPSLLTIAQLRLAFSTMVSCVSDKDDNALAWFCMTKLLDATAGIPARPPLHQDQDKDRFGAGDEQPLSDLAPGSSRDAPGSKGQVPSQTADDLPAPPSSRLEEASSFDAIVASALRSPRGHLLLVLIDQLASVNACWLEPLADRIAWLLAEERHTDPEARRACIQTLYKTLAGSMDMNKREAAAKWWLSNRGDLEEYERTLEAPRAAKL